jgi:hypothetical protein
MQTVASSSASAMDGAAALGGEGGGGGFAFLGRAMGERERERRGEGRRGAEPKKASGERTEGRGRVTRTRFGSEVVAPRRTPRRVLAPFVLPSFPG